MPKARELRYPRPLQEMPFRKPSLALILSLTFTVTSALAQPSSLPTDLRAQTDQSASARGVQAYDIIKLVKPMMQTRDYVRAQPLLEQAVQLDPNDYSYNIHNYLGLVYENTNKIEEGIAEYKKMLSLQQPGSELAQHNLSNMYSRKAKVLSEQGNLSEAEALLVEAIRLNPTQPMFHNNLGSALQTQGDLDGAIAQYQQAVNIEPNMELATLNLAKCYLNVGQFEQAKFFFAKYVHDHPDSPKSQECRERLTYLAGRSSAPEEDKNTPDYFRTTTAGGVMRWPPEKMPIKVYIDPAHGINGFRPAFAEALAAALTSWSRAANNKLSWVQVKAPGQADIVCTFAPNNANFQNHLTDEQGEVSQYQTYIRDGQRYINHAVVAIATYNPITGRNLSDGEARNVSLHEIGHALGLVGHSPNYHDIMFFITNPGGGTVERKLSTRDVATINMLYPDSGPVSISR